MSFTEKVETSPFTTTQQLNVALVQLRKSLTDEIIHKIKNNNHTWDRGNSKLFAALDDRADELESEVSSLRFYQNILWFALGMTWLGVIVMMYS